MKRERSSRAKILDLLREQDWTVRDLASRLGLTNNAIRANLAGLQGAGLVRRGGSQSGRRKPHVVYTLTDNAAHAFPNAYGLLLRHLVGVLATQLSPQTLIGYLRRLGRQLALEPAHEARDKSPRERRRIALDVLGSLGGQASLRTKDGIEIVEGRSCPLAALTGPHPTACIIVQTVLSEIIGQPVEELCVHGVKPRCRFQISA
jgi:predicted ArsR family transcriptional regulator